MKKEKLILGIMIILVLIGVLLILKHLIDANTEEEAIVGDYTPQEEITEEQFRQTIVNLYFPGKESHELMAETRLVDVKNLMNIPCEKLVNMLIDGPKNEKLENIMPKNTKVLKTYFDKDCIILDLSKDFLNYDMEKENIKENLINSIVKTLTELNEVNSVKILIEGQENEQFKDTYVRID